MLYEIFSKNFKGILKCGAKMAQIVKDKTLTDSLSIRVCFCTRSRGRTGTALRPLVFETSASTDSAIRAVVIGKLRSAKVAKKEILPKKRAIRKNKLSLHCLLAKGIS